MLLNKLANIVNMKKDFLKVSKNNVKKWNICWIKKKLGSISFRIEYFSAQ